MHITLSAEGVLTIKHWQGEQHREFQLCTDLLSVKSSVTLTYTWDAPLRRGVLALEVAEGALVFAELTNPLPMSMRDGLRIMSDVRHCAVTSNAAFVAIANEVLPVGVLPTLGGQTMIETPKGNVAVSDLRAGQMIVTATGQTAQVRWCGSALMPARGRFAPVTLRAPYFGLRHDIVVAPDQRVRLEGTEVEYLFGTDVIAVRAGHLMDEASAKATPCGLTHRYWQVLLDRAAPMKIAGVTVEGLDIAGVQIDPSLRKHSAIAALPAELVPARPADQVPLLQSYETLTLRKLTAA